MNAVFGQWQVGRCATVATVVAVWSLCGGEVHAKPLGQATVTQVNNDVRFKPAVGNERPAKPKDVVKGSDTVRTGLKSQAELEFEDHTITRLGSNSSFTFDPDKREFQLHKGLLLFDMPKNAGGGKIITPAGTAAIEGTAGIITYRSQPKIICLAGVINVLNPNGQLMARVMPGQLFILGVTKHPVDFNLSGVKGGKLLSGGLPNNKEEFTTTTDNQQQQIQSGQLQTTPFVVVGDKTDVFVATSGTTTTTSPVTTTTTTTTQAGTEAQQTGSDGSLEVIPTTVTFQSTTIPDTDNNALVQNATTINVTDSTLKIGGAETGPSSMSLTSSDNLMVDPSTLWVHSGPGAQAGSLHLESTGGRTTFVGSGPDPFRSYARASVKVGTGIYDGGTVELISGGTHTMLSGSTLIPLDGVFIHDAVIDANYSNETGYLPTRNGGTVLLDGKMQVLIEESVDINANGSTTPGTVTVQSSGNSQLTGDISLRVGDPTGHIAINAQTTAPSVPSANSISINGWDLGGSKTIVFNATGPLGGGEILLSTAGDIQARNTDFNINSSSCNGGDFSAGYDNVGFYPAANINFQNIKVNASSTAGTGGNVALYAGSSVQLGMGTEIYADGGASPGSIIVSSPGPGPSFTGGGFINVDAMSGNVNLSGQKTDSGYLSPVSSGIGIFGEEVATTMGRSVELDAFGGSVRLSAFGPIDVEDTAFNMDGGGTVQMGNWNGTSLYPASSIVLGGSIINGNSAAGTGGQVELLARNSVFISGGNSPSTDIQVNGGGTAGSINITAQGNMSPSPVSGAVQVNAGAQGYVRLSAQQTAATLPMPGNGTAEIEGAVAGSGKSINIVASGPTSGGNINVSAAAEAKVVQASLVAGGSAGGIIEVSANNNVTLNNAWLNAIGSSGAGGSVDLNGSTAGVVSLTGSRLLASGASGYAGGLITLRGGEVDFYDNNTLDAGANGLIFIYRDSGTAIPSVTGRLFTYTYAGVPVGEFSITSSDTISASSACIFETSSGVAWLSGTLGADNVAAFSLGTANLTMTGDPVPEAASGQDAKFRFTTTGNLTIDNFGNGTGGGAYVTFFRGEANNILVQNSDFSIDGGVSGPGMLELIAANNLSVDPSTLGADGYRGSTTPLYDGGTIHLEGGHVVSLTGTGWPAGRTEMLAGGVNGGTVSLTSTGQDATDKVYLHYVGIDATTGSLVPVEPSSDTTTLAPPPASSGPQGGNVSIQSNVRVQMEGTTAIQTSGERPGTISITALGTPSSRGAISLDAQSGIIGLLATTFRVANDESFSLVTQKSIHVEGTTPFGGTDKTIQFSALGGWALFSAENDVEIRGATVNVSAVGGQDAGTVWAGKYNASYQPTERTHGFNTRNVDILANASTGRGGTIMVMADADNPDVYNTQAISIGPNSDIQANSAGGAGTIALSAEGGTTRAAEIGFNTERHDDSGNLIQEGFVRLTAVNSSVGSAPATGNIVIQGTTLNDGSKSINITAKNSLGGQINFNAKQSITVMDVLLDVDPTGPSSSGVSMGYYDESAHQSLPTGRISLTGTLINGNSAGGQGASVMLDAYERIDLLTGTDIQANGGTTAGGITASAYGKTDASPIAGQVNITATSQGGVRLGAQLGTIVDPVATPVAGSIVEIIGAPAGGSDKSIYIFSGAPGGGISQINITAPQAIAIQHALLEASSPSQGGAITLTGNNITLGNALLHALGTDVSGLGGNISLIGGVAGTVSLGDSSLWAYGGPSAEQGGTITLKGGTINFFGLNDINAGSSGNVYVYRDSGNAIPYANIIGNLSVLPYSGAFAITSADTLDASTAQIINDGSVRFTGTLTGGVAVFDLGSLGVTVSSSPAIVPAADGTFNAEFRTLGTLLLDNMPEDTSPGGPGANNTIVTFRASTIHIANTFFRVGGEEIGPSSLRFYADGNLIVDPSTLKVLSGPADASPNPAGLLHLESANGLVSFVGSGYDPGTDLLRSHAKASVNVGGNYNGGTVEFVSLGTHLGVTAPTDGVFVRNATIDVSNKDDYGSPTYGDGGQVLLDGRMQVLVEDTVCINANGTTAGGVTISTIGDGILPGLITLKNHNSIGFIDIEAQTTDFGANGGDINFFGVNSSGNYSINLVASGLLGGGTISATTYGDYYTSSSWVNTYSGLAGINIRGSRFNVNAPTGTPAGRIILEAPTIVLFDSYLSANSDNGAVGRIEVSAKNPNGSHVGTGVNIAESTLTVGGTADPLGGILISGDLVTIDSASAGNFSTGPANVHIQSRQNTGEWPTNPTAPIYWSPLYFTMDDYTMIDVSGATPTITGSGGSLNGTFTESGVAVFDFGAQNVLLWPNNPHATANAAGLFEADFITSGSFESLNMTPTVGGGPSSPLQTSRVNVHASAIQIINSIFNMGDCGALNGPSQFQLFSTSDAIVASPYDSENPTASATVIEPKPGMNGTELTGGKFHLESAGVTAFFGSDNMMRVSKVLLGASDMGGTVEIISTGDGTGTGGSLDGVHIRHAFIDVSHPLISDYPAFTLGETAALWGGSVTLDGVMQVDIRDTTDIYADGATPGSIQVTSTGTSLQPGMVTFHVEDSSTPGHVFLSARPTTSSSTLNPGNIALWGTAFGDGSKNLNITASGPAGGGLIEAEAPLGIWVAAALLDASALPGTMQPSGTIRLHAGASSMTPAGSEALQLYGCELRARGFDGGTVTTLPVGTGPFYLPANLEMHGAVVDVSSWGSVSPVSTPHGGEVNLQGTMMATISGDSAGSTTINADGPTVDNGAVSGSSAGDIQIQSPGSEATPGNVTINADATHYVRLSAHDSALVFDAMANGGNVDIHGASSRPTGSETIQITASGPAGGGIIAITAAQNLSIINAQLNANGAGSLPAGTISLSAANVNILNSLLTASSASGQAGRIQLTGSSSVSAINSILQTLGASTSANSGIYIYAPTVNLAGSTLSPGPTGPAQIYATTLVSPPASGAYTLLPYGAH